MSYFYFEGCDGEMDIVIALDSSGSIRENRFEDLKKWIISFVEDLEISQDRTRVGLVMFSDNASMEFHLSFYSHKEDIQQAVGMLRYIRGMTNIAAALRTMRSMFTPQYGDRYIKTYIYSLDVISFVLQPGSE